eukprot:jgi/Pico_ML_1/51502/g2525.t1
MDVDAETELQDVMRGVKEGLDWKGPPERAYVVSGTGNHLGMDVLWRLSVRPDGAFREEEWESLLSDVRFPKESVHVASAGGTHNFVVESSEYAAPNSDALLYRIPVVPPVPHGTSYSTDDAWVVPAWRSASGHVLVKPKIDGKEVGLFILDTGASGFVVEPSTADKLGMTSFGELFVAGVGGKEYISPPDLDDKWVDLHLVSGVPHVPAHFAGAAEDHPQLFMLDSGAGGVGAMFHHRGVEELNLLDLLTDTTSTHVDANRRKKDV